MPGLRTRRALPALLAAGALLVTGCGSASTTAGTPGPTGSSSSVPDSATVASPSASPSLPSPPTEAGVQITTGDSDFGTMLFDGRGQAIYLFDKERSSTAECYDTCARAWPPVLTDGTPQAQGKVRQSLLGTTARDDGTTQVTYAGQPLYFYAHEKPGQVLCHDVREFGGLWLVVTPRGTPAD